MFDSKRPEFKALMKKLKKLKWRHRIVALEAAIFIVVVVLMHIRGVCAENPWRELGQCQEYMSFLELPIEEYIALLINLILLIALFLALTSMLGKKIEKNFKKSSVYKKIAIIEICIVVAFFFAINMLLTATYDGYSCMLDNCSNLPLFLYLSFWGLILPLVITINPISAVIFSAPYLIAAAIKHLPRSSSKSHD